MKKYALIMIDMQRGFIDPASPLCIPSAAATIPACARAIGLCHGAGIPSYTPHAITAPTAATWRVPP